MDFYEYLDAKKYNKFHGHDYEILVCYEEGIVATTMSEWWYLEGPGSEWQTPAGSQIGLMDLYGPQ